MSSTRPDPLTIPGLVANAAERWPDKEAVVDGEIRLTYRQLKDEVDRVARSLMARGVQKGDRIAIWAPNSAHWMIASLGLRTIGAWLIPVNTRFKPDEAETMLARGGVRLVFTVPEFLGVDYTQMLAACDLPDVEEVVVLGDASATETTGWDDFTARAGEVTAEALGERAASIEAEDVCDTLFTAGTTGVPKGAMVKHGATIRGMAVWADLLGMEHHHRQFGINPFFHVFGLNAGILVTIMRGATIYPMATFDVTRCLEMIAEEQISMLPGPPTVFQMLIDHPDRDSYDLSTFDIAMTGSASIPPQLVVDMQEVLGFRRVATAYGLTEAAGVLCMTRPGDAPHDVATTSGRPVEGVSMRVVDDDNNELPPGEPGELVARTPFVMAGYLDDEAGTAAAIDADGYLHTGDVGYFDENGNVRITDRKKDMFIVGGFNVYSAEVEHKMLTHPAVAQAAIVGAPDRRLGQVGYAYLVLHPGVQLDREDFISWCRENMANYKVPRFVEVVSQLPVSAVGKVLKYELRDRAATSVASPPVVV